VRSHGIEMKEIWWSSNSETISTDHIKSCPFSVSADNICRVPFICGGRNASISTDSENEERTSFGIKIVWIRTRWVNGSLSHGLRRNVVHNGCHHSNDQIEGQPFHLSIISDPKFRFTALSSNVENTADLGNGLLPSPCLGEFRWLDLSGTNIDIADSHQHRCHESAKQR